MRRIALSAGHTNSQGLDNGAPAPGTTEGKEAVIFRDIIKNALNAQHVKVSVDPNNSVTGDTVRLFRKYFFGPDVCIDIHFNSSTNKKATGVEAFVPDIASGYEKDLAYELCYTVATCLGIRNRGWQPESKSARRKLFWMTIPCETILLEVCFASNPDDWVKYSANKYLLGQRLADTIYSYLPL